MNTTKLPITFWIISGIALLWNLMGVSAFASDMMMTPEKIAEMSQGMQDIYNNNPYWSKIAYGVGTIGGLLGSIGLLMRKNWAVLLFLISLLGIIVQTSYNFFGTNIREELGDDQMMLPIMIILIGLFLWYYAKKSASRGWLS